jgi:hypothetical protein
MDLAIGVALGSSIQIGLGVIPAVTLAAWAIGKPLTLDFHPFETTLLVVSVLIVNGTIQDSRRCVLSSTYQLLMIIEYPNYLSSLLYLDTEAPFTRFSRIYISRESVFNYRIVCDSA